MPDNNKLHPLQSEGVVDYHCHCDYSIDAEGTIDEYCEAAVKRNLAEICFTTHYDTNPNSGGEVEFIRVKGELKPVTPDNLAPYVDDVRRAAEKYYSLGLSVKVGVEIGWYEGCEEIVKNLKDRFALDYVLCGIHELEDVCFCCSHGVDKCFSRYSAEQMVEVYFGEVKKAAESRLFDTIAHLSYYLRSGIDYYGENITTIHRPFLQETFKALVASSTGIEVNTSARRHGLSDYYPPVEIINAARKSGVEVRFLGSDAHLPDQVGFDFEGALALIPSMIRGCED